MSGHSILLRVIGALPSGRTRRRLFAFITAATLVAPLLLAGAFPVAATAPVDGHSTVTTDAAGTTVVNTTVTVTVTPKDSSDVNLGAGQTVSVSWQDPAFVSHPLTVTDVGNGTYTATL